MGLTKTCSSYYTEYDDDILTEIFDIHSLMPTHCLMPTHRGKGVSDALYDIDVNPCVAPVLLFLQKNVCGK